MTVATLTRYLLLIFCYSASRADVRFILNTHRSEAGGFITRLKVGVRVNDPL